MHHSLRLCTAIVIFSLLFSTAVLAVDVCNPISNLGTMNQTPNWTANMTAGPTGATGAPGPNNDAWYLWVNGTRNMSGSLNMSWFNISNVITSTALGDAANVSFVEAVNATNIANLTAMNNSLSNYAYNPGRNSGQILNGGIANNQNLTLNATSNGVGNVIIQPNGGNVSIGAAPQTDTFFSIIKNGNAASLTGTTIVNITYQNAITTPLNLLNVFASGYTPSLLVKYDRVGIGTSTPRNVKLDVVGGSLGAIIDAVDYPVLDVRRRGTDTDQIYGVARFTHNTTADMVNGFASAIDFTLQDSAGVDNEIASIAGIRNGADNTGDLIFRPALLGTVYERMRVRGSNGFVGIGTPTPGWRLNVNGTTNSEGIQVTNSVSGNADSDGVLLQLLNGGAYLWNFENGVLAFATNNIQRMSISALGNVSIVSNVSAGPSYINKDLVNLSYAGTHGAATGITNGATITHLLGATPTGCQLQATVPNTTLSYDTLGATTFTVRGWMTNVTNRAMISQSVAWECWQ